MQIIQMDYEDMMKKGGSRILKRNRKINKFEDHKGEK